MRRLRIQTNRLTTSARLRDCYDIYAFGGGADRLRWSHDDFQDPGTPAHPHPLSTPPFDYLSSPNFPGEKSPSGFSLAFRRANGRVGYDNLHWVCRFKVMRVELTETRRFGSPSPLQSTRCDFNEGSEGSPSVLSFCTLLPSALSLFAFAGGTKNEC